MSVNIMDMVKGAVSDQVMGQIGGLLGTDAKKTPSLFETAAGSILGGLMKKSSTPQGAQDIFGAVGKQDSSILDNLGGLLGGGQATDDFQKQGTGILDLITGGSQQSSGMIGMVAKALGLDNGIVGKLLTMAAPILMGVIGKHVKDKALDAVGLGNLLGSQGPNLSGVLPSSLTSNLGFGDMLGSAGNAVNSAAGAVGNLGSSAAGAVGNLGNSAAGAVGNAAGAVGNAAGNATGAIGNAAGSAAQTGGGLAKMLMGLIPLALIGLAAWFFLPGLLSGGADLANKAKEGVEAGAGKLQEGVEAGTEKLSAMGGGLDFGSIPGFDALGETGTKLTEGMSGITSGLTDVTDEEGATALADKISGFTGSLDGMGLNALEGPAKEAASGMIGQFVEVVKNLIGGKSEAIQGILQPVIGPLMEKLSAF